MAETQQQPTSTQLAEDIVVSIQAEKQIYLDYLEAYGPHEAVVDSVARLTQAESLLQQS